MNRGLQAKFHKSQKQKAEYCADFRARYNCNRNNDAEHIDIIVKDWYNNRVLVRERLRKHF